MTLSHNNHQDPLNRFSNASKFIKWGYLWKINSTVSLHNIWVASILKHFRMVPIFSMMFEWCSRLFFFTRMCLQTDRRHQDKHKLLYVSTMASRHNKTITHPSVQTDCPRAEVPYLRRAASVVISSTKSSFLGLSSSWHLQHAHYPLMLNLSVILSHACYRKPTVKLGFTCFGIHVCL